ncbi:MAG: PD40 domain-containing protein, partial [Planctomycetaceae bacterium]|nr:PD40 domain-containing protein [Planctomycetaceae bacterium]
MQLVVRIVLTSVVVFVHSLAVAGEKRLIDIDDYFTQAFIVECEMAPSGEYVAYVELRWEPPRESRNADLWLVNVKTQETRRLTFESASDSSPTWSLDSKQLYFTSRRKRDDNQAPYNGKTQVFRLDIGSGQITPITRVGDGIDAFELSKDGNTLYYSVTDDTKGGPWASLRKAHQSVEYGVGERNITEIWKVDLKSWRTSKVVDEKKYIHEFAVSPDEKQIAIITTYDDLLITHEGSSQVDLYNVETKKTTKVKDDLWRKFETDRHGWLEHPVWSPDGTRIAFRVDYDGYPAEVFCADVTKPQVWQVKRPAGVSIYGGDLHWEDDCICFLGDVRARTHVYRACDVKDGSQGETVALTKGDHVVFDYSMASDGALCVLKSDPTSGRDLFLVKKATELMPLTDTNPQMEEWKLPQISLVKWKGANGDVVEGILELPPDYKKSDGK